MTMVLPDVLTSVNMNVKTSVSSSDETLSDYERVRMQKIVRNNAKLRSLGLMTQQEEKQSNARATKSRRERNGHSELKRNPVRKNVGFKKPFSSSKNCIVLRSSAKGARSSLRLQGLPASVGNSNHDAKVKKHQSIESDFIFLKSKQAPLACQSITSSNKTATYEHCAMRIRTLSHAQLQHRIRVVERAAGRHCVIKLQIMVQCFRDHELHDLAHMAESALQRLAEP